MVVTGAAPGAGAAGYGPADAEDARIQARVEARLVHDPRVPALDLHVRVVRGVVTLEGRVPDAAAAARAVRLARGVPGVRAVISRLHPEVR
ncbi:MAG: BON domain-containing protein [Gammaproteobacteria bacterium]|nr:MAG: BON domain-containing protein [Gammaproteobacteria bacterium]